MRHRESMNKNTKQKKEGGGGGRGGKEEEFVTSIFIRHISVDNIQEK